MNKVHWNVDIEQLNQLSNNNHKPNTTLKSRGQEELQRSRGPHVTREIPFQILHMFIITWTHQYLKNIKNYTIPMTQQKDYNKPP